MAIYNLFVGLADSPSSLIVGSVSIFHCSTICDDRAWVYAGKSSLFLQLSDVFRGEATDPMSRYNAFVYVSFFIKMFFLWLAHKIMVDLRLCTSSSGVISSQRLFMEQRQSSIHLILLHHMTMTCWVSHQMKMLHFSKEHSIEGRVLLREDFSVEKQLSIQHFFNHPFPPSL